MKTPTLTDLIFIKKNFLDRKILICREMTKFYEEFTRSSVKDLKQFDQWN